MRSRILISVGAPLLLAALICRGNDAKPVVHMITLPSLASDLPPGPGRDVTQAACTLCHSSRYILNQPSFPRKKWADEVEKMRKTYGAPIGDPQVPQIVEYLDAIRGADEPAGR
jgi:hypothetical protein